VGGSGEWLSFSSENFCIFYFKMVSFYACLHGFLFGIFLPFRFMPQAVTSKFEHRPTPMLSNRNRKMFAEQIDKVVLLKILQIISGVF